MKKKNVPGGRPKGSRNSNSIREAALKRIKEEFNDWDPLHAAAKIANETNDPRLQLDACRTVLDYTMPKLKAIEVTGANGGAIVVQSVTASDDDL